MENHGLSFPYLIGLVVVFSFGILLTLAKSMRSLTELRVGLKAKEVELFRLEGEAVSKDQKITLLQDQLKIAEINVVRAEVQCSEMVKSIQQHKEFVTETEARFQGAFKAISDESLKNNHQAFIGLAEESLGKVLNKAKGEINQNEQSIKTSVTGLSETLKRYEEKINHLELKRREDYGGIEAQIKQLIEANKSLKDETGNLVTALRRPEVRGRWGEVTLKRVVELAGMTAHCDFTEQVTVQTEQGNLRPDMVIHLPSERDIVVDSKVSLDAYIEAISANSEAQKGLFERHAKHVRKHMKDLGTKAYWEQFAKAPEFVVLFIPGESFLSAAAEQDPMLIEDGMANKVIVATPSTLIALLRAVAFGWRQEQVTKNAQEIANLGKELHERFGTFIQHLGKMRTSVEQSVYNFNRLLGSFEGRILPSVRKFKDLGVTGADELPETLSIDQVPREIQEFSDEQALKKHTEQND